VTVDLATELLKAIDQLICDLEAAKDRLLLRAELAMSVALDEALAPDDNGDLEGAA
jgi:hypothetical protein